MEVLPEGNSISGIAFTTELTVAKESIYTTLSSATQARQARLQGQPSSSGRPTFKRWRLFIEQCPKPSQIGSPLLSRLIERERMQEEPTEKEYDCFDIDATILAFNFRDPL